LYSNRKCNIDTRCVWSKTGSEIIFNETENPEISTIKSFSSNDSLSKSRQVGVSYSVSTISLVDLLNEFNAPKEIDYLSIDTEGSEFEILRAFNFELYRIKIISVEHNYSPLRDDIYKLLTEKGFRRMFEEGSLYDDWYVLSAVLHKINKQ
jgi:FkbM family methyltransferase